MGKRSKVKTCLIVAQKHLAYPAILVEIVWWYHNTRGADCWLVCWVGSTWSAADAEWCGSLRLTVRGYGGYGLAVQSYRGYSVLRMAVQWDRLTVQRYRRDDILRLTIQQGMCHGFHWGRIRWGLWGGYVRDGGNYRTMLNGGANWCRQNLKQTFDNYIYGVFSNTITPSP
jgi:hypothetical protein